MCSLTPIDQPNPIIIQAKSFSEFNFQIDQLLLNPPDWVSKRVEDVRRAIGEIPPLVSKSPTWNPRYELNDLTINFKCTAGNYQIFLRVNEITKFPSQREELSLQAKDRDSTELPVQATFNKPARLLLLDGDDGTVACRIYGNLMSATFPRFSDNWTLESATRSFLRMNNLTAVRGMPGASMVGPIDYLGNLEDPDLYLYTIRNEFPPIFYRTPITREENEPKLNVFDRSVVTVVKANWISGGKEGAIEEKKLEYNVTQKHLRQSLFLNPGLLEIDRGYIDLKYFDARGVDLSSFKARLVSNDIPFQITKKKLPSKDEYRLVTYLYEPHYADWQIQSGSGLFLEKHLFSQTITPITPDSSGFVVLARTNENPDELEMIGVQIPYGHTLIIEEECIHGDTTLNGFFMMGMTSDHTTMRTADTVFLKCPTTKKNVGMEMVGTEEERKISPADEVSSAVPPPYVIYKDPSPKSRETFRKLTRGKKFIFNPLSREYWKRK